ncbi:hypothetical protein F0562_025240 [Nyssa sinensis]|uniref:Uncharacterized protein n=1 Tax=Nyssa sinensis TaxID=561372 RepID=A0A5J5BHK1_9ASTE|nr:hypothetical protein F0562_025240 [Nyssa sinensis]
MDVTDLVILDAQTGHTATDDEGDCTDTGDNISLDTAFLPSLEGNVKDTAVAHEIASEILSTLSRREQNSKGSLGKHSMRQLWWMLILKLVTILGVLALLPP